jgi:hypothetical protein
MPNDWLPQRSPCPNSPAGNSTNGDDARLCNFACSRGYCPDPCVYSVPINFDGSCSNDRKLIIRAEMAYAYEMAVAARDNLQWGDYYNHFFSTNLKNQADFAANTAETYRRIADSESLAGFIPLIKNTPLLTSRNNSVIRGLLRVWVHCFLRPGQRSLQDQGQGVVGCHERRNPNYVLLR